MFKGHNLYFRILATTYWYFYKVNLFSCLDAKDLSCEELIIDTIVTINNLTFYSSDVIFGYSQKLIDGKFGLNFETKTEIVFIHLSIRL